MAAHDLPAGASVGFETAIRLAYANYATMAGRATRAEYWWFYPFTMIVGIPSNFLVYAASFSNGGIGAGSGPLLLIADLLWIAQAAAFAIPTFTLAVRRLHDTNRSAHYLWFGLLPFAGQVVIWVLLLLPSDPAPNRYGPRR